MLAAIQVQLEFDIHVPQEDAWRAMLEETEHWWLPQYLGAKNSEGIRFEPRPGGRLYESSPSGGMLWYTIIEMDAPHVLAMSGDMAPPYGGPATSILRIEFTPKAGGCRFQLRDHIFGVVDAAAQTAIETGWRDLFESGLKSYVEHG